MRLSDIIDHWPSKESYHTRWTRATRAAKAVLEIRKAHVDMELNEQTLRLIVSYMPRRAPGHEQAKAFLKAHEGFPLDEWIKMCEEHTNDVEILRKEYEKDMESLDEYLPEMLRRIEDLENRLSKLESQSE